MPEILPAVHAPGRQVCQSHRSIELLPQSCCLRPRCRLTWRAITFRMVPCANSAACAVSSFSPADLLDFKELHVLDVLIKYSPCDRTVGISSAPFTAKLTLGFGFYP